MRCCRRMWFQFVNPAAISSCFNRRLLCVCVDIHFQVEMEVERERASECPLVKESVLFCFLSLSTSSSPFLITFLKCNSHLPLFFFFSLSFYSSLVVDIFWAQSHVDTRRQKEVYQSIINPTKSLTYLWLDRNRRPLNRYVGRKQLTQFEQVDGRSERNRSEERMHCSMSFTIEEKKKKKQEE